MKRLLVTFAIPFFLFYLLSVQEGFGQKKSKADKKEKYLIAEGYFTEGMKLYVLNNYADALSNFQKAYEINPENAGINYMLGKLALQQDKYDQAISYAQKSLKQDPKNKYYYLLLGEIYEKKQDYPEALKVIKKLLAEVPDTEDYLFDLAALYLYTNNVEEAIKIYDKIESHFGKTPEVSKQKQLIFLQGNKLKEAIAEGESLINAYPEESEFKIRQAEILYSNNKEKEGLAILETLVKEEPDNGYAWIALADYYKNQGEYDKSLKAISKAFQNPEVDIASKITLLEDLKKLPTDKLSQDQLIFLCEDLKKVHPSDAAAYGASGDVYFIAGNKEKALLNYTQSKNLNPNNFNLWNQILMLDSDLNRRDSLIRHSEQALEIFPNQAVLWLYKGGAYLMKSNYNRAIEALEEGKKLSSSNNDLKLQFLMQLGDAYNGAKEFQKSDDAYEEVLKFDSKNAHVLNNYSYFLSLRKDKLDHAKTLCERLIKEYPSEPTFLDTFGWVLYILKDYPNAKIYLEKAALSTTNGTIYEHYGDVLYQLGEKDKALEYWQKAKVAGETSEFIDKKIRDKKIYE
ncbi:tetratricopeptide repeat protein [Sporocytophaga myxococcoides]|uniref:tetratricopeptide repeat protein n=1 Tax=Sporocytophaga myxococcoides TaxID=153721 RepID=UPI0004032BFB|nr:tetratricopeptide repeat protein [Sporocytophaga myxococcoides]